MTKLTNKIKSVLSLKGFTFADYARKLDAYPQTLNNKAKKNTYKIQDFLDLADLTNTELCLRDSVTHEVVMTFHKNDLEENND